MSADRNLLFGVLALQLDFITHDQLIAGLQAWVNDKGKTLPEILQAAGALSAPQRQALEPLVAMHIQQHGNDPQQSLASLSSADRLRGELDEIQDRDVQQSLVSLGQSRTLLTTPYDSLDPPAASLGNRTSTGARFRIIRPHARGGLGEVFVAHDTELGREVALKEIHRDKSGNQEARARFTREAEITGGLEHPGIVPVYGLGAYPDGRPFYAMRFIRGKSLQDAIKAYHSRDKASATEQNLELRRLLQRLIDVCEAIDYAHSRGVLHRDLKPGNIMLGRYGETLVVDWGLAKALGEMPNPRPTAVSDSSASQLPEPPLKLGSHGSNEETQLGFALGTPAYMSPEQAQGRLDLLSPQSDVFSLGATLFQLLTGKPPYFEGDLLAQAQEAKYPHPRTLAPNTPAPLVAICLRALARRPQDRYPTAQAFAQDIERYLADEPIDALPESPISLASRWTRRHRAWMQAGGAALLLVAITAIGAYFFQRETAEQNRNLASHNLQLAQAAQAQAESLRASLAQNYFAHGVSEYGAGRPHNGVLDLQRGLTILSDTSPLRTHYEQVLLDRAMHGGRMSLPLRHAGDIVSLAFSPQGDRIVTGSKDGTARLWDARTGAPLGKPLRHAGSITVVAFSPRGDRVLTGSEDEHARLWDARTGVSLGEPLVHENTVIAMAFSPQGDRIVTGSVKFARLWDARTGKELIEPVRHSEFVWSVAFSPQGDRVLTGCHDATARLWDARTGEPLGKPLQHDRDVWSVAFSPQGDRVVTGSEDRTARLWDARTGEPLGEPLRHEFRVWTVAFSPQGDRVLTGSDDNTARLWDARTGAPVGKPLHHDGMVKAVAFSPQGDRVLTGSRDKTARLWNARTGAPLGEPLRHDNEVVAVAFSPQGHRIVTGSEDTTARFWSARTGGPLVKPLWHEGEVRAVAFSPQGDRVLTGGYDRTARLWDAQTGAPLGEPLHHDGRVRAVAFSPEGDRVLTGSLDYTARLWDARTGAPLGEPLRHEGVVTAVAFSRQGDRILTGSEDKTTRLWDAQTGAPVGAPLQHEGRIYTVSFSPEGDRILTGSDDMTARVWDVRTGAPLGKPLRHAGIVHGAAFSPQGDRVLTGSEDGRLWDAWTGEPLGEPLRHEGAVVAVAFSPEGDRVLTGSWDKTARLWDARTGAPLGEPLRHPNWVEAVAFSPQGDRAVTGCNDNTARLWDVAVLRPKDIATLATLVTGFDVHRDGNAQSLTEMERNERRERFYRTEAEWIAAIEKRTEKEHGQYLLELLLQGLNDNDLFTAWQSVRWLPAAEHPKADAKSLKTPAMQVLIAWFRDGNLDQVAGALMESAEAGAGKVLAALEEAIPVLYWETDERLGALRKELRTRAMQQSPPAR